MSDPMYGLQKLLQLICTQPFVCRSWAHVWDLAPSVWSLQMAGSPVETSSLWRRGQLTSHLLLPFEPSVGHRTGLFMSVHLLMKLCTLKRKFQESQTQKIKERRVAQSNEEYIWLKAREHGYCSLLQKYSRRSFFFTWNATHFSN